MRGQHDKKSDTTKIECGKRKEVRNGKKLKNVEFPILLVIPEYSLKLQLSLSEDGKEFVFFANGRSIFALPYFYGKFFNIICGYYQTRSNFKLLHFNRS